MAVKQAAFIVVKKTWFNTAGINDTLANGKPDASTGDSHYLMTHDFDLSDHRGIWINDVTTTAFVTKNDGLAVTMKFMIPWSAVLGLGLVDESATATIGFQKNTTE